MREIVLTDVSLPAKRRILTTCVQMFLEKGYKRSSIAGITEKAEVSCSTFQNIFHAKDGVLAELVEFMFDSQLNMARSATTVQLPPVYEYAVETAIQITLTELNENLREIYIEAYTQEKTLKFITRFTARELYRIFGRYQPELKENDFYVMDIGSAGLMRGFMSHPCDTQMPLEKKLESFLLLSLRGYKVPEEEVQGAVKFVFGLDVCAIADGVLKKLFSELSMHFDFKL